MESVCLKCGDVGFIEAIVFCNKCEACALHRYCLDGPVIFTDEVIWFCEDCEPKQISQKTKLASLANYRIQTRRKLKHCVKRLKERNQQHKRKIKEKGKNGKVKSGMHNISHEQETESKNECEPVPSNSPNSNVVPESIQISQVTVTDDLIPLEVHVDAQPIAEPIWRGNLLFCDKSKTTGTVKLLAHLSSLASPKVLEEVDLFPEVLSADLLPRSAVWPTSFKKKGPTDKSIALYFFPVNESVFDKLVDDIIRTEEAVRVVTENAVLLIFPSTLLPIQHQRFQSKHYLWGVFKKKQTSLEANDAVS
ncbi:uncharacterized protein LOC131655497 [Vicia villosa]|uniref:uncharacterized protein LOC131612879 n=1 Tax=Vicia villosa TaxID=3911 RepID=UPI00273B39A9|nr:uncharacterized protein LOC131612879 [Vicia villosa]XP_058781335.1 uncharacterized protein LOC131655497 [Vicia villosa]